MKQVELYAKVRHAVRIEGLSERAAARRFGIDPRTASKMLEVSVPPGYRRTKPPVRPKLDAVIGIIDRILEEQANLDPRDPRAQELYLTRLGKSEKEVREEVSLAAEERLRRSLVLSQLAEAESITVSVEDVENELQTIAASIGQQAEGVLQVFGSESGRDSIRRSLLTRRTLDRLVEIVSGEDTPKEPAAEARTKQAKRRRAEPRKAE